MTPLKSRLAPGLLAAALCIACGAQPAHPPRTTSDVATAPTPAAPAPQPPPPTRALPALGDASTGPDSVAVGTHGAVTSSERHATEVGLTVLRRGGNAVDAAVAVGFALAVTHPTAGNLGGGGFMVLRMADGRSSALDYRETAPASAHRDMYLDAEGKPTRDSVIGPRAAGIPGTVAGLALAHARYGSLPWAELVLPAVALARDGHVIDDWHEKGLTRGVERMRKEGFDASTAYYLAADGSALKAGDRWQQPELAATLQRIADGGADAFYRGAWAEQLASKVRALGGLWTAADLAGYRALEREPVRFDYLGHEVLSMPPPSAGGVVMRQILAGGAMHGMSTAPYRSVEATHLYVEAARRAYADRNYLLGDPDFGKVPVAELTGEPYIRARMGDIDPKRATPSSEIRGGVLGHESHDTTHYSVVDDAGNAVSNTYTLNTSFGSKVVVPGTGILLNNEMDDFAAKPGEANVYGLVQGERNRIEGGKRMLSSMTPTIVSKGGALRAVLGTPGGPTITTTVTMILRALLEHGRPLDEAVAAPRIHHQWMPDRVVVEPDAEPALIEGLRALGHQVETSRWGRFGHANCIEVDPATGGFRAVADVGRRGGAAMAY